MKISLYAKIVSQLFVLAILSLWGYGQTGRLFTVDSDLSSSLVEDIHQDRSGYIWIATEDGLNKYDGIKFTVYRQNQLLKNSILHNIVRVVTEDSEGRLYIGYINGMQYFDPATADFHTVPFVLDDGVIVDAHVKSIFQRKNGQLLVGTSGFGMFEILHENGRLYGRELLNEIPSEMIETIFEDSKGRLWVATENSGLFKLDDGRRRNYLSSRQEKTVVSSIAEDSDGMLWFGSRNQGLFSYDEGADTFVKMPYEHAAILPVTDIVITADNSIYVATDGKGVKTVDKDAGALNDLSVSNPTFNFARAKMHSLLEDRDGNLWMGAYQKGVFMLPSHRNQFGYMGYKSVNRNVIGGSCVMSIFQDQAGSVWVGTDNDGLYRLGAGLTTSEHFVGDNAPETVMTVFEDSYNNLWVGSYLNGLTLFDRESGKFTSPIALTDKHGAKVERVFHIVEDPNRQLWVATMGTGLFRINLGTGEIKRYNAEERSKLKLQSNSLPNDWINCLLVLGSKLYFGTYDGLGCLDLETGSFVSAFGRNRIFSNDVVYSLFDDKQGNLWVGTSTGLKALNLASLEVSQFDMTHGLPSNTIWSIESDHSGHLWLSTNRGIARMDLQQRKFINFHSGDGLQGDEFMRGVSMKRADGTIFFGGLHGVSYFDPEIIQMVPKKLGLHVVDLYIRNQPVNKGMKSGSFDIIDTTLHHETVFQMAHHDNSFAIEFSTMDFNDSERVVFQYSMNQNEWVYLRPSNNRIAFENLPQGMHRLRVRAVAGNAVSAVKEITFIIHPVWYLSDIAKLIYLLFAVCTVVVLRRTSLNRKRIRQQIRSQRKREEINDAKLQLFVSIAHEIKTPLTLIVSPLKKLMQTPASQSHEYLYRIMDRNVHRILDMVNQMMDAQKIEKGMLKLNYARVDMVSYTKEVCALFEEQLEAKDIRLKLKLPEHSCWAMIDPNNFDKVLVNVLANACRFTPSGGWIEVELKRLGDRQSTNTLLFAVADSGQPLDELEMDRIFECFYQSDKYRNHNSGAGIGLYLAKQLVMLHGGEIRAENLRGGGCRFVVTLPGCDMEGAMIHQTFKGAGRTQLNKQLINKPPVQSINKRCKKVVIVDDDLDILTYLHSELAPSFHVTTYTDGGAAFNAILADPPDLILSDVMMPLMDGFSLCNKIRNTPNTNHIPVILLTAKISDADSLEGFESGADAYITKPFCVDVLLKAIEGITRNRDLILKNEREKHLQEAYIANVTIKSSDEKLLEKVHRVIGQQLANPLLSVEMIASEVGISRVHLHRKLKQLTNMTTRDLIRSIRLKQAARLIKKDGLSVSEVAYAVGYSDLSNFSLSFKQIYGVSPSNYAAQQSTR